MKEIISEAGMNICFETDEAGRINMTNFSTGDATLPLFDKDTNETHQVVALHLTNRGNGIFHNYKHSDGSNTNRMIYESHELKENSNGKELIINLLSDEVRAEYHMFTYSGIAMVRTFVKIINISDHEVPIDYISSFLCNCIGMNGDQYYFDKLKLYLPRNSWCTEAQWTEHDISDLMLSKLPVHGYNQPDRAHNRFSYGSATSWSSWEYLPMGMIEDAETGEIWYYEIEHSGSWNIEFGSSSSKRISLMLLGPNNESVWFKKLKSGESFTTVPVACGVKKGGIDEAIGELTRYRRLIRRPNADDRNCTLIFNDYMNCLFGDPTEEKDKNIIDIASELGCEYFCVDAGWYDSGAWWNRVGEWKESRERFPNGLKYLFDYGRLKGLKMGLWVEIEVMGIMCDIAKTAPDDWFFCVNGMRRMDSGRYMLDFRNKEVRDYCTGIIDRLVSEYGCEYFKIDYNCTTGFGSELHSDSLGDAMLEHYRCLYNWIRTIYKKYPDIIIENCGSGGQRMDYGMLTLHSLQSTSDQMDVYNNAHIAANVASAVTPEQAGMWVYPYETDEEHIIYNMINGILLRPYLSGNVWKLSKELLAVYKEGIDVYKNIRSYIPDMCPVFPLGFSKPKDDVLTYGLKDDNRMYLSVFLQGDEMTCEIDLGKYRLGDKSCKVIYPVKENCEYSFDGKVLKVKMPDKNCARLFSFGQQAKGESL